MPSVRRSQRGFTLTELLVVITILGVMAAAVAIAVRGFSGQADSAACKTDARAIVDAEEVHHAETGDYVDEAGLVAAGRIVRLSSNHDVTLISDGYEVVGIGSCAPTDEVAGTEPGDGADELPAKQAEAEAALAAEQEADANAGKGDRGAVDGFGDGWFTMGDAALADGIAVLAPEKPDTSGDVFFGTPLPSDGLRATFVAWSGRGGEGLAFVLRDPEADMVSPGKGGSGLGFAGIPGYAVTIDTVQSTRSEPSQPFVGIARGNEGLEYVDTSTAIDDLVESWHEVTVEVHGSTLVVSVDGKTIMKHEVNLSPEVIVGFTGATGDAAARQVVSKLQIGG